MSANLPPSTADAARTAPVPIRTPLIRLDGVSKRFKLPDGGSFDAVKPTSLTIERGEIFGLVGKSGAGKSTLLRLINLLQNANVFDNVAFPLRIHGQHEKAAIATRVAECLALVGLEDKVASHPAQLSGGQKQRVAIARALASAPDVLLCDEPTSALDAETTESLLATLRDINATLGVTIVIVTHQLAVVTALCHRVAVVEDGRVAEQFVLDGSAAAAPLAATRLGRDLLRLNEAARAGRAIDFAEAALA